MVRFLIHRPVAVFMVTMVFLILGSVAINKIPVSLMPNLDVPEITVQINYKNNTAREIETNVIRPLRNQLLQVSNLKNIESQTRDGSSTLKLLFKHGTKIDYAFIETNEKLDASIQNFPRDLERPKVIKASITDIPVLNLTVSLENEYSDKKFLAFSEFAETVIKKRIEQLPDIAIADLSGQIKSEVIIVPKLDLIRHLGVSISQISNTIKENNFDFGDLQIQNGAYQFNLRFSNPLKSKKDIEEIYLKINQKIFQLKDIADVKFKPQENSGMIYFNGKRAVVFSIVKQSDAQMSSLKNELDLLIESFKTEYGDISFQTSQDQTKILNLSINNLKTSLYIGGVLAILMMFVFLGDFKSPLIIFISIPVSLMMTILLLYILGLSINIISLSGLILGVGMMIDNSIIVIDNITQRIEAGSDLKEACIKGTNDVISPLISSVLTTCSIFLPLLFLSGITGALIYEQALAVSIGLSCSLIISITLIPVCYNLLNSGEYFIERWSNSIPYISLIESWHQKTYLFFKKRKYIIFGISFVSILLMIVLFIIMPYSQLPNFKQKDTILSIDWNENINVNQNQIRINELVNGLDGVKNSFAEIGEQSYLMQNKKIMSSEEARLYIEAKNYNSLIFIKNSVVKSFQDKFPLAKIEFKTTRNVFQYIFGSNNENLITQVYSRISSEVPEINDLPNIRKLINNSDNIEIPLKQNTKLEILYDKLLLYNVDYNNLKDELKTAFNDNYIDNLKISQKYIPIKINYNISSIKKSINQLTVANRDSIQIPIRNLLIINKGQTYKTIHANKVGEYLRFESVVANNEIENVISTVEKRFENNSRFAVMFTGSWFNLKELKIELLYVVIVSILLLYFILAAQFESLIQPIIILIEIPIDIGASLFLLFLFNQSINVMAAIGIVVMSGIIINDSILKIHTINQLRKTGHSIDNAIKLGGQLRLKPILMTSITTILALIPFLFIGGLGAELQKPLAITVIGGMFLGTFISLYFIPIIYKKIVR